MINNKQNNSSIQLFKATNALKRVKNFKYENPYTYIVKLSRVENIKKIETKYKTFVPS
jgi:hypothetical protein